MRRELNSMKLRNTKKSKRPARRAQNAGNSDRVNVPVVAAYTIRNTGTRATQRFFERELIGFMTVGPATPSGSLESYDLNPLTLVNTKMRNLALNFEKFRFRRARLTVGSNFPTTVAGNIITGYAQNPDQAFGDGVTAIRQVFALLGAQSTALYAPVDISARIMDKAKWYNIDQNSAEKMSTTQGKFMLVTQSPASITTPVDIPLYLEYDIEFSGSALQEDELAGGLVLPMPALTITSVTGGVASVAIATGETLTYPTLTLNLPYLVNPPYYVNNVENIRTEAEIAVLVRTVGGVQFSFYEDQAGYNNGEIIGLTYGSDPASNNLQRTTFELAN
jgi:hypothetical protein